MLLSLGRKLCAGIELLGLYSTDGTGVKLNFSSLESHALTPSWARDLDGCLVSIFNWDQSPSRLVLFSACITS